MTDYFLLEIFQQKRQKCGSVPGFDPLPSQNDTYMGDPYRNKNNFACNIYNEM